MGNFKFTEWISYCKKHKILGAVEYGGIVIETDEENPKAVAYIPGVVDGIVPAPGYKVRLESYVSYMHSTDLAELMAPEYLRRFSASAEEETNSMP